MVKVVYYSLEDGIDSWSQPPCDGALRPSPNSHAWSAQPLRNR